MALKILQMISVLFKVIISKGYLQNTGLHRSCPSAHLNILTGSLFPTGSDPAVKSQLTLHPAVCGAAQTPDTET